MHDKIHVIYNNMHSWDSHEVSAHWHMHIYQLVMPLTPMHTIAYITHQSTLVRQVLVDQTEVL